MKLLGKNEKRRLEVLWQYDVLDTPPESGFDALAELAAEICGAPIATITFIDEKRQWFKAKVGLTQSETAREISFCGHAILGSKLLVVPDVTKDPRFSKNPLVTGEPRIRFYAGAPLINPEGYALGTICVIDTVARELSGTQLRALVALSKHVVALLELRRKANEARKLKEERDLAEAKSRRFLENAVEGIFQTSPEGQYLNANLELAAGSHPHERVVQILACKSVGRLMDS